MIHLYVPDAGRHVCARTEGRWKSLQEMTTQFYGDRSGGVEDPPACVGIAMHVEDVSAEEMERRAKRNAVSRMRDQASQDEHRCGRSRVPDRRAERKHPRAVHR